MNVPRFSSPTRNRQVLLIERPTGIPQSAHFRVDDAALVPAGEGQVLVRNLYLSVDPAQRGWAADANNYASSVPIGSVMRALGVGIVIDSRLPGVVAGNVVYGWTGWQDYAVLNAEDILSCIANPAVPISAYAGILGINGITALLALRELGRAAHGDTVLVSTAAGAVGSVVGQLATAEGCRALGLTGSDDKAELCTQRFGYAAAFNYKAPDLWDTIDAAVPDGFDVYFDNVGGDLLDMALRRMKVGGRVVQCGTASVTSWTPSPAGLRNEREVLLRRLCWNGFVIFDHKAKFADAIKRLEDLVRAGQLAYDEDIEIGIERAPDALRRLYAGENAGKKLIFIG